MRLGRQRGDESACERRRTAAMEESGHRMRGCARREGESVPIIDESFLAALVREPVVEEVPEQRDAAFKRIIGLLGSRDRCSCELVERLKRAGFEHDDAVSAVDRAVACGLVDDARYADVLIRSRISQGKGRAGIEEELAKLHIVASDLEGWPEAYFPSGGVRGGARSGISPSQASAVEKRLCGGMPQARLARLFPRCRLFRSAAIRRASG